MLYSSAEERRAAVPNVPGWIPGVAHIFVVYFVVLGQFLVRSTNLNFVIPDARGSPPTCRFGMMCSYALRSHTTHTEGSFCSMGESCDLILRHTFCPFLGALPSTWYTLHTPPYESFSPSGDFLLLLVYPIPVGMEGGVPGHSGPR